MHGLNGSGRGRWPRAIVHQQWLVGLEKKKKKRDREGAWGQRKKRSKPEQRLQN
jgi:hypothetical protein